MDDGKEFALQIDTEVSEGQRYLHVKSGGEYTVVSLARIENNLAPVVVYQSDKNGSNWVRPLDEFEDGRFVLIAEDNE